MPDKVLESPSEPSARTVAALTLVNILSHGRSTKNAYVKAFHQLTEVDQSFCKRMVLGVCRFFYQLDALLNHLLQRPFKRKDQDVRAAMLLALYQLQHLETEEYAAVAECLKTLEQLDKTWAKNLANGVLRRFIREFRHNDKDIGKHICLVLQSL